MGMEIFKNKWQIWNQHFQYNVHAKFREDYKVNTLWTFGLEISKTKASKKFKISPVLKFWVVLTGFGSLWLVPGFSKYARQSLINNLQGTMFPLCRQLVRLNNKFSNNKNTREKCELCSNLTVRTPQRLQWRYLKNKTKKT